MFYSVWHTQRIWNISQTRKIARARSLTHTHLHYRQENVPSSLWDHPGEDLITYYSAKEVMNEETWVQKARKQHTVPTC